MGLIVLWEREKDENNIDVNLVVLRNNQGTAVQAKRRRADGGTVPVPLAQHRRCGRASGWGAVPRSWGWGHRGHTVGVTRSSGVGPSRASWGPAHGVHPKTVIVFCTRVLFQVLISLNNIHAKSSLLNLNTDRQKNLV